MKVYCPYCKKEVEYKIEQRELKDRFFNEWIPLEEKYFTRFDIFRHCDVII